MIAAQKAEKLSGQIQPLINSINQVWFLTELGNVRLC
jgi:hypothetical protein